MSRELLFAEVDVVVMTDDTRDVTRPGIFCVPNKYSFTIEI